MTLKPHTVLHLPCSSLPWTTGGKEIYTHALAKELDRAGWTNHIALHQNPWAGEPIGRQEHEHISIHVLPPLEQVDRRSTYSCRSQNVPGFAQLLAELQPAVVHFHDFSISANLLHLDLAKRAGAKTVMTYHSPGQSCLERELLYNGATVCDGEIIRDRCTACRLGVQGVPSFIRWPLAKLSFPSSLTGEGKGGDDSGGKYPLPHPSPTRGEGERARGESLWQRALSARHMTDLFAEAWRTMVDQIDCIHIFADWVKELMRINRVPEEKLAFFRTGLPFAPSRPPSPYPLPPQGGEGLRVAMLGRCERIKGQEVLIDSVQALPASFNVKVSFFGPYWDQTDYGRRCLKKISGDQRFEAPQLVPHAEIPQRLAQADLLVVPSLWLETGPLVVLEGFAAGLPIVGSRLGGIAELVRDGETGLLFEPGDANDLRRCLERLQQDRKLLERLRSQIQPPRTMADVAADTAKLYEQLLAAEGREGDKETG